MVANAAADNPKSNILVVDDSAANLKLLSSMLGEQGYKVRSVISGPMALTATRAAPPDLILLDINMPGMNGYQVCEQLKGDERTREIPIIFISALDEIEDKVRAFTVGGVDYVTKPFQFEEVLARVQTHLALQDARAELARHLQELQARNEELDAFAHTVAHDLKNPLTSLLGYANMVEERGHMLSEEQRQGALSSIGRNARRMGNIVEELLLLAGVRKMEQVSMEPLDMAAIVQEVQARLADILDEQQARVAVPDDWPVALGRGAWIEEVWANYMSNAVKYGGQPPCLELGYSLLPGTPGMVRFWLRDNGRGLSAAEQARLFAPFERLHQVRAEGHGLGLSIVRRIVEKLGGQVGVESEPGRGSTFSFTLPAGEGVGS